MQETTETTTPATRKTCTACKQEKPLESFNKRLQGPYGRASDCRECANARVRRYKRNRASLVCSKCGERRAASEFSRHRWRPSGLNTCCKTCDNNRRSPSVSSETPPGHCTSCGKPPKACTFPVSKPSGSARPKRSAWCLACHRAFRKCLTPEQARREAEHWIEG